MNWVVTKRRTHGEVKLVRWVVLVEGRTRGICECWDEGSAQKIALFLNMAPKMFKEIANALNAWYPSAKDWDSKEEVAARARLYDFFLTLEEVEDDFPSIGKSEASETPAVQKNPNIGKKD